MVKGNAGDVLTCDADDAKWAAPAAAAAHDVLSASHGDTVAAAVSRGSLIYGNSTPKWDELVIGSVGKALMSDGTDVAWTLPSQMIKRIGKVVMNNATAYVSGLVMTSAGTLANDDDDNSNFARYRTGSTSGNAAGTYSTTENFTRGHQNPTFYCKFKTYSSITNQRFFIGFWAGSTDWNQDDPTNANLACLRYVAGTANFTYVTKDGATLNSQDSGVAVAASTVYTIKIVASADGTAYTFSINGAAVLTLNANLPAAATPLGFGAYILTKEAAYKYLSVSQIYVEAD
ncbi:MAG: hypothetical protein MZV70_36150 [Desulfobacterales bacterium]|nr:hypothetical protein [Desulfobacterales bacterium]